MMFGPTHSQLDSIAQKLEAEILALYLVLEEKGIVTHAEVSRARARAVSMVDQAVAHQKAEALKEFSEQYPEAYQMLTKVFGPDAGLG
jgi:TPP-dependent pyruvate/acetoin dehydrogenase alpha subunit